MNVRLKKSYAFSVGIFLDDVFHIQEMNCTLEFYTNTTDSVAQNIAIERWHYFLNNVLNGSVLVDSDNTERIDGLQKLGIRVVDLPDQAYDQIVGLALYLKLNTIAETALVITDVSIASDQGQYVFYQHNENEGIGSLDKRGWWDENSPSCCNVKYDDGKIVKLKPVESWRDLDLHFDDDEPKEHHHNKILQFSRDEN